MWHHSHVVIGHCCFWSTLRSLGTNFNATRRIFKSSVKILWQVPWLIPTSILTLSIVRRQSSQIIWDTLSVISGRPERRSSTCLKTVKPLKCLGTTHSLFPKSCLQNFITFCSSFPQLETDVVASALFTEIRHLDNRRENVAPFDKSWSCVTRCTKKPGFQHTSPWYLGNNTSSGWCGNYSP